MNQKTPISMDLWMHELYRCIKSFIHNPTTEMQKKLTTLLGEYRTFYNSHSHQVIYDEHEKVMDYR